MPTDVAVTTYYATGTLDRLFSVQRLTHGDSVRYEVSSGGMSAADNARMCAYYIDTGNEQ